MDIHDAKVSHVAFDENPTASMGDWTEFCDMDKIELMQYTGLNDKNDREIYEGDIIEFLENESGETWTAKIVFENLAFKALDVEDECYEYDFDDLADIEVIGNIYENPELLKDR